MIKTAVRVTSFGQGQYEKELSDRSTVNELLNELGIESRGQRVAVNGHHVAGDAIVELGDEVTVVPRVQGG